MSGQTIERLPEAELEVMQAIWDCEPPVSRADIEPLLQRRHPMATTTLLTLLGRLTQKGVLQAQKRGKSKVYTPAFSRGQYVASQGSRFLSKLCRGDVRLFATALCEGGLSREEVEELRRLLEEDGL